MLKGYLSLVFHAHLPFVRHPEHPEFLEEDWLYEAIIETYVPLIKMMDAFLDEEIDFRLTMSITPPLANMLTDKLLQNRFIAHLERLIGLAHREVSRTSNEPPFNKTAKMYLEKFEQTRVIYLEKYDKNLLTAFRKFQDTGKLEIITCGATHGFFPLTLDEGIKAQVRVAVKSHEKHFGRKPAGIWLPECGYKPGVEQYLREEGIRFFIIDTHGILYAKPAPRLGVYAPVYCRNGVAAFGRDVESSKQVWSAEEGYPGDYNYREFYRDIGFDLDFDYIKPYIHDDWLRINTGIKYYRITGKTANKEPYDYEVARSRAAEHAGNFLYNRQLQAGHLADELGRPPLILSPYDAELFGHWWYEGPDWIDFLVRKIHYDQDEIALITPKEYLELYPTNQVVDLSLSSWGHKGYCEVWLEGSNDWIYRHLHAITMRMVELADPHRNAGGLLERALNQAAREVLLAQSSDWAFIMKTGTMVEYAVKRTKEHIARFNKIYDMIMSGQIDETYLRSLEEKDNIFPEIDFRAYL